MLEVDTKIKQREQDRREIRLRFIFSPEGFDRAAGLSCFPDAKSGPPPAADLSVAYFDSPDRFLSGHGMSLWVERSGRRYIQALDVATGQIGVATICRAMQNPVRKGIPDLATIGDRGLRGLLRRHVGAAPERIFRARLRRTSHQRRLKNGAALTADFEVGEIISGSVKKPVGELTLRLESGPSQSLFDLALEILSLMPLRVTTESRASRGLNLTRGQPPGSHKAKKVKLGHDATVEDALAHTMQHCLDHVVNNEACVLESDDSEGVHQMRVALRRLRSGLRIFQKVLPAAQFKKISHESKVLAGQLGAARDWDVFLSEIVTPMAAQFPDEQAFRTFQKRIEMQRRKSRNAARKAILSRRYTELLLRLSAWLAKRAWRDELPLKSGAPVFGPAKDFADTSLSKAHQRVCKAGEKFATLRTAERHQMRIEVKKLRYAVDFFSSLYSHNAVRPFRERLASLQDGLGYLNDVAVAQKLVKGICRSCKGKTAEQCHYAGGAVIGWHARALVAAEPGLSRKVTAFLASEPFWLGRT